MSPTHASGSPAYVAAHRISVVDGRLPFDQAFCLATLVVEHAGGPVAPGRTGPIALDLCKQLSSADLVLLTTEMLSRTRATVRLTVSPSVLDEFVDMPAPTIVVSEYEIDRPRRKAHRYAEVTQAGLDLVVEALRHVNPS